MAINNSFESNVGRLWRETQTETNWRQKVLSIFMTLPILIWDLGRWMSYSCGFSNGKSISLISESTDSCKLVAEKVHSIVVEELDSMELHAKGIVVGFDKLNIDSTFSSPNAIDGFAQIEQSTKALAQDVLEYVQLNAKDAGDVYQMLEEAKVKAFDAIDAYAKGKFFVPNKMLAESVPVSVEAKKGLDKALSDTPNVIKLMAQTMYQKTLSQGLEAAENTLYDLVSLAESKSLLNRTEADAMLKSVQVNVEDLSEAVAKDVLQNLTSIGSLGRIAHELESENRLNDVGTFLERAATIISEKELDSAPTSDAEQKKLERNLRLMLYLMEFKQNELINRLPQLADVEHDRLNYLRDLYSMYRKEHFRELGPEYRALIERKEAEVDKMQERLNANYQASHVRLRVNRTTERPIDVEGEVAELIVVLSEEVRKTD